MDVPYAQGCFLGQPVQFSTENQILFDKMYLMRYTSVRPGWHVLIEESVEIADFSIPRKANPVTLEIDAAGQTKP